MAKRKIKRASTRTKAPPSAPRPGTGTPAPHGLKTTEIAAQVEALAGPALEAEGMELVLLQYGKEPRGHVLRFYVDKPGGVTIEDCAFASRHLGDLLDAVWETDMPYFLEVSSPGLNRPLVKEEDFNRFHGRLAVIRTGLPLNGRRKFKGRLLGAADGNVGIVVDGASVAIPLSAISTARLQYEHGDSTC